MISYELARMVLGVIPFVGRGYVTTRDIESRLNGEGLNLHIRTIQNYVDELCDVGDIIEVGKIGRSRQFARVRLKREAMCPELALALSLSKQYICSQLPSELVAQLNEQFDEALNTVESLQNKAPQNQLVHFIRQTQQVSTELLATISLQKPAVMKPVLDALYHRNRVELTVEDHSNHLTLTPVSLFEKGGAVYLRALPEGFNCKPVILDFNLIFTACYPAEVERCSPRRAA